MCDNNKNKKVPTLFFPMLRSLKNENIQQFSVSRRKYTLQKLINQNNLFENTPLTDFRDIFPPGDPTDCATKDFVENQYENENFEHNKHFFCIRNFKTFFSSILVLIEKEPTKLRYIH